MKGLADLELATALMTEALAADDFARLTEAIGRREAAIQAVAASSEAQPSELNRMRRALHLGTEAVRRLMLTRHNLGLELARAGGEQRMLRSLEGSLGERRKSLDYRG